MKQLAQIQVAPQGGFSGFGPLGNPTGDGVSTFSKFLSSAIGLMTIVGIIWFIFVFVTGAIGIVNAGSDKGALETNRKKITIGIVGLVFVIISLFVVKLIGFLLGIDILNIQALFDQL
jgi:hypothetical protein